MQRSRVVNFHSCSVSICWPALGRVARTAVGWEREGVHHTGPQAAYKRRKLQAQQPQQQRHAHGRAASAASHLARLLNVDGTTVARHTVECCGRAQGRETEAGWLDAW